MNTSEVYTDAANNYTIERVINDDEVIVYIKSLQGDTLHVFVNKNGVLNLDGKSIQQGLENDFNNFRSLNLNRSTSSKVKWQDWQFSSDTVPTGGLATALIAGAIAAVCPWAPIRAIAAVASVVAGKYDEIEIRRQIRYGRDSKLQYYERVTSFYGEGKRIYKPIKDKGKTKLD